MLASPTFDNFPGIDMQLCIYPTSLTAFLLKAVITTDIIIITFLGIWFLAHVCTDVFFPRVAISHVVAKTPEA